MLTLTLSDALQVILGLGLLNVWLLRSSRSTSYRGGSASSLRQEFGEYGLPTWFYHLTGFLKLSSACMLLLGLWFPVLIVPAASLLMLLMVGALAMHLKISDPISRSTPALAMLSMCILLLGLQWT